MNDTGTLNFVWSQALVAGFVAAGVKRAVISPGSRSTPLALALLRQPALTCHVIVDERSAAFFALGLAKAEGLPVLVLATSGSAPANWFPAIIEASQSGVPLIFLSADRPPELHGCGANQTLDQQHLFGQHVRCFHDAGCPYPEFSAATLHALAARLGRQACWPLPGPVHVNQPFREPLLPAHDCPAVDIPPRTALDYPAAVPSPAAINALADQISGRPGLILCGEMPFTPGFAEAVTELAERLACPILAEPLSNLRCGAHDRSRILTRYDHWLRTEPFVVAHRPEWILRFGAYPVTRRLQGLASSARTTTALIDPWPRWNDPSQKLTHLLHADPETSCRALLQSNISPVPGDWLEDYQKAEAAVSPVINHAAVEGNLIPTLLEILPDGCPVFVGNSLIIRDLDAYSGSHGKSLHFFGNRGASGIDGNLSTAFGIAAARGRGVALIGDLTCQHDMGGLAAAKGMDSITIVFNNGGGGIFDHLPQAGLPEFEAGWLTPQSLSFSALAATFGFAYWHVADTPAFRTCLETALKAGGPHLVEVSIDRTESRKLRLRAP